MKNISKYILAILSLVILITGCRDEDVVRLPEFTTGAVPYVEKDEATDQVIDFFNKDIFSTTLNIRIGLDEGAENVQSAVVVGTYNGGDPVEFSGDLSSFPASLTINISDITSKFGLDLDDLQIGDQIIFGVDLNMKDGRRLYAFSSTGDFGYSAALRSTPRNSIYSTYNVTCVSNIPVEGTWTGHCVTDWGYEATNENITITALGNGEYEFSDVTGGFYGLFGFNVDQPAVLVDVCNNLTITASPNAQFSIVADPDNVGTWDLATETFVIYWFDDGNVIKGITTITRN